MESQKEQLSFNIVVAANYRLRVQTRQNKPKIQYSFFSTRIKEPKNTWFFITLLFSVKNTLLMENPRTRNTAHVHVESGAEPRVASRDPDPAKYFKIFYYLIFLI